MQRATQIPRNFHQLFEGRSILFKGRIAYEVKRRNINPRNTEEVLRVAEELCRRTTRSIT